MINPRYELSESVMLYGRFASGYRPGGPNFVVPPPLPPGPPTFSADTVWNYELGAKTTLGGRATIDFDVFYIDWSDIQLLLNRNSLNSVENGGSAKVLGGEIVSTYLITTGLVLGGNMTYSRATLTEDVPGLQARSGQRLPLSPEFSAALMADYNFELSDCCATSAGFSYRFVGKRPSGFNGSNVHPQYWLEVVRHAGLPRRLHSGSSSISRCRSETSPTAKAGFPPMRARCNTTPTRLSASP